MVDHVVTTPIDFDLSQFFIDIWWSFPIGFLVYLLLYFFTHPEKISIWSGIIHGLFAFLSKNSARRSVSNDIQARIDAYVKNNQVNDILPYGIKFKWIKGDNFSSFVEEDDVIIIMDYNHNNARNFVNAILQYTSKAFLPNVRNEIPSTILHAAELVMQEKIIQEKRPDALETFRNEIVPDKISSDGDIKSFRVRFQKLDGAGFFDNIFLSETAFAGPRLDGLDLPQKNNDFEGLLSFLEWIITRKSDDESRPLHFEGNVFRTWLILVAKAFQIRKQDTTPYLKRAQEAASKKFDSIYVAGREQNMSFTGDVIKTIKEKKIGRLEWIKDFKTRDRKRRKKNAKLALFRL